MNVQRIRISDVVRTTAPLTAGRTTLPGGVTASVVQVDAPQSQVTIRTTRGNDFTVPADVLEPAQRGSNAGALFDPGNYTPGTAATLRQRNGGEVRVQIEGHDHRGQAVVRTPRGVEHVPFRALSPQRGVVPQLMRNESEVLLQGIQPNQVHSASPVIRSALNIALQQRRIVGRHTAQEYVNALRADGHSVALVGGAIRDVVQALRDNPNTSAQQLSRLFADLDIVTTAAPSEVRRIAQRVAPEARGGGIWSSTAIERFGIVGIGARKDGLDVASLRSGPPGQTTFTLGKRLGDDAASRDFTFNQLYYLYDHGVIVDPAGSGIRDAEQKQLRVNTQSPFSAETLSMRFFKFRIKGYSTDRQTRDFMRRHIERTWPRLSAGIPTSFLRCIPADCHDTRALRQFIRRFEQAMANDGMQDLFDRFIRPNERAIVSTFASRQGG